MSHRGFQSPPDEVPDDAAWDDESQWDTPKPNWGESWSPKEWNDEPDGEFRNNGRHRHPSAHGKRPRNRRGRNRRSRGHTKFFFHRGDQVDDLHDAHVGNGFQNFCLRRCHFVYS